MNLITIENVQKSYNKKQVLKNLNLDLKMGAVYTLLGKNGAGKTTLINILLNLVKEDSGIINRNLNIKKDVGVVFQEDYFPSDITLGDLIRLQSSFFKKKVNVDEQLELYGLQKEKNQKTRTLSGGQKRKLSLLLALLHQPKLLILDEPTAGMDYDSVEKFVKKIKELKLQGVTILLITHDLYQIESFSDYILLLNNGFLEKNVPVEMFLKEEVYDFPTELFQDKFNLEQVLYYDDKNIVIKPEVLGEVIDKNRISNLEKFKRNQNIIDIFKRITFIEGEK